VVDADRVITLPGRIWLRRSDLRFEYSRSPGPGGQNVNKVASRVTLLFDVEHCPHLSPAHKARLMKAFPGRINREGVMRVVSSRFRTQAANRKAATERFVELVSEALTPAKRRRQTGVPARERARRLAEKARRGERKRLRRSPSADD
jgi:ribosome-associated protein